MVCSLGLFEYYIFLSINMRFFSQTWNMVVRNVKTQVLSNKVSLGID